ncbi:hypothetical protein RclHR1_09040007 [Rhizophagus clarus]|uniref:Uncharacterized protein n=1 Tax=Rhizophagus clarus TaxID=94130 RepID=A0A2Z6S2Q9_9GLOM|nr:hypothetical protein RclHR1_09040007 [Rhizophagus clarus]GES73833.1 hypothetical protein GLOIN_2v1588729 [Rhizophagus clarus]
MDSNYISNNYPIHNYSTENEFIDNNNNEPSYRQTSNVGMPSRNHNSGPATSGPKTFEFYFPLSNDTNDTRIYYVTYTELNSLDIARRLNENIDLSHIPNYQLSNHHNVQNSIQRQIVQRNFNVYNCNCNYIQEDTLRPYDTYITDIQNSSGHEVLLQPNNYQLYRQ